MPILKLFTASAAHDKHKSGTDINLLRRATGKLRTMKISRRSRARAAGQQDGNTDGRCYLLELPTELLLEINSHLTALPEACLALTCRRLFAISAPILDSKCLRFTRDFAPLFHHYRNAHNWVTPRWKFINLLEDTKWRACSKCLKLHPRDAFPPKELKKKPEQRTCSLGEYAGVVDLCPCKKITFRDKTDLVDLLTVRRRSITALTQQFGDRVNQRFCWHSCLSKYGSTELKVELYPELDDDDNLVLHTYYRLSTDAGQLGKEEYMTPRFGCAHRSLDLWLSSVCQTSACHLYESFCSSCRRISVCNSCNTAMKCPRKQPWHVDDSGRVTYYFTTERRLGGTSPVPDEAWALQRIHPARLEISAEDCTELCPWTIREHPPLRPVPSLGMEILDPAVNDRSLSQLYSSIRMI